MKNESFQLKVEDTFHEIVIDVYDDRKETIGFFRLQDIDNPRNSFARLVYHRGLEACRCFTNYIDNLAHDSPGFISYTSNNNIPCMWELEIKNYYEFTQSFIKSFLISLKNWIQKQEITISDNLVIVLRNCNVSQELVTQLIDIFNSTNAFKVFRSDNTEASHIWHEDDDICSIMLLTDKPLINFLETYDV